MKTISQLIDGRSQCAQPAIRLHYPGKPGARSVFRAKEKDLGDDLLSQTVASPVPSALTGLTAVFGMGTGVSPSLWSPKSLCKSQAKKCFRVGAVHAINTARISRGSPLRSGAMPAR